MAEENRTTLELREPDVVVSRRADMVVLCCQDSTWLGKGSLMDKRRVL